MATINYNQNQGGGFTVLPEGTYDFCIVGTKLGKSSNDNPQLEVKYEVDDGPHSGKTVRQWYTLTEKASWKLQQVLDALGIEPEQTGENAEGPIMSFDDEELLGRHVQCEVKQREFNGKTNNDLNDPVLSPFDGAYSAAESGQTQAAAAPPAQTPVAEGGVPQRRRRQA